VGFIGEQFFRKFHVAYMDIIDIFSLGCCYTLIICFMFVVGDKMESIHDECKSPTHVIKQWLYIRVYELGRM